MSMKHPDQRVAIFIDVQNLYYSAKALYEAKVNFSEIISTATAGRKLVRAIAYTVKADMPEEQSFFDALEKLGIEVRKKDLQTFVNGAKKGDWDVGIAVDMLKMAPKVDAVVLCSGDGDFELLLHHTKAEGCRAEVISFGRSTSAKLIEEADDFIDMDQDHNRYLLRSYSSNRSRSKNANSSSTASPSPKKSLEDEIINAVNGQEPNKKKKIGLFRK